MEFDDRELEEFKTEALELLEEAETQLLVMENPKDFSKNYATVFRAFHSLKGAAGMLELDALRDHMHKLENIFHPLQNSQFFSPEQVTFFLKGVDVARTLLDGKKAEFDSEMTKKNIPSSPQDQQPKIVQPSSNASKTDPLIYVIDDDEDILDIIQSMISKHHFRTETFLSPKDALEKSNETPPDLVLTDMQMPGFSGIDVLKRLKEIDSEIPVIFISGFLDKNILIEALNLGVSSVLNKPISETLLLSYVAQALQRREMWRLLNRSVDMVLFQLKETEKYLISQGKTELVEIMRKDTHQLLEARRNLRTNKLI